MLRLITGPFHPYLERALLETVKQLKASDPLTPFILVAPSDPLRRRLLRLLCVEHGCALLDVHVLTFHQFALRLLKEAGQFDSSRIRSEWFFHELVHQLLKCDSHVGMSPGLSAQWSDLADMPGAWGALFSTVNDLQEARVDPERVLDAVTQTGLDDMTDVERLMSLYRAFLDERERMQIVGHEGLTGLAEPFVETSPLLQRQHNILFYGLYDMTQVQLDLFRTVARLYPTTLFFPLAKGAPAYEFAERFYERYLFGFLGEMQETGLSMMDVPQRERVGSRQSRRILSVAGTLDELTVVAKDILSLTEERGYAFHEIGVVARSLSEYERLLPRVFEQHAIPFSASMTRPLSTFPFVRMCFQMLDLRANGYRRDAMLAVLSSPFFRFSFSLPVDACVAQWDLATRRLGITKGLEEWRRLTAYLRKDLPLRDDDESELLGPRISSYHIQTLWAAVSGLSESLQSIPDNGTWEDYSDHVVRLLDTWLDETGGSAATADEDPSVLESLTETLSDLRWLSDIQADVSLSDFVATLQRALEATLFPMGFSKRGGVQVLDAMGARGVSFRALYIIGLTEKIFPRHIREDAFLRDRVRRFLDADLGFKIQEKLSGYEEEHLLFTLLCESADEQLTLVYQRIDDTGRALLPSGYIIEAKGVLGDEVVIPRRLTSKFQESPQYHPDRLTPAELALKCLLQRQVPRRLLEGSPSGRLVARGLVALPFLDGSADLGEYDGMTGPIEAVWHTITTSGVSPTALQEYAACPFRYFAKQVLRLQPITVPQVIDQVGPLELGTLVHNILRRCLERLKDEGYFEAGHPTVDPASLLGQVAGEEFERFAHTHPVGYPLIWRLHQERLLTLLNVVLRDDLEEMARGGWQPVLFEEDLQGRLNVLCAPMLADGQDIPNGQDIPIGGRLDRVDWSATQHAYRIIDYKFKTGRTAAAIDKNLILGAVRATRLQPPFYLTMDSAIREKMPRGGDEATCRGVWFYYIAPAWENPLTRVEFPGNAWSSSLTAPLMQSIAQVLSAIRSGRYFMYPSEACDRCDYRLLCRKSHQPTVWRARLDHAVVHPYRLLRSAKVAMNGSLDPPDPEE